MQFALGNRYFVLDAGSLTVSPISGGGRQVTISKGTFGGFGILDDLTQDYPFTFPGSAGDAWYLLAARRSWGVTQKTDFVAIDAGTGAALPARSTRPGTEDDQPVALVQVRADGSIGTVRDLRAIGGHGNFIGYDDLIRTYLLIPGATLRIGDAAFTCALQAGSPTWVQEASPYLKAPNLLTAVGASVIVPTSGWSGANLENRGTRDGNVVEVGIEFSRTGATIGVNGSGGLSDVQIGTVTSAWAPSSRTTAACYYRGGSSSGDGGSYMGLCTLDPSGAVYFVSGSPNMNLNKRTDGGRSLTVNFVYVQR